MSAQQIFDLTHNEGILPLRFLPFAIRVTTYYASFSAISTAGLVSSALSFPLPTRFAGPTNVTAMEPAR